MVVAAGASPRSHLRARRFGTGGLGDATAACEGVDSITFTHTMNDQESPVMAEIAEAFEGTTVEVTQIPFDGAQAAYDQQAAVVGGP